MCVAPRLSPAALSPLWWSARRWRRRSRTAPGLTPAATSPSTSPEDRLRGALHGGSGRHFGFQGVDDDAGEMLGAVFLEEMPSPQGDVGLTVGPRDAPLHVPVAAPGQGIATAELKDDFADDINAIFSC